MSLAKYVALKDILITPSSLAGPDDYSVVGIGVSQTFDSATTRCSLPRGLSSTVARFRPQWNWLYFLRARPCSRRRIRAGDDEILSGVWRRPGLISSLSSEQLPIDERFFNGGATTVRSFSELTLGPKDRAGYPLGGQGFTVFNIGTAFPIWGDLYGALFTDAGNVIESAADFGLERHALRGWLWIALQSSHRRGSLRLRAESRAKTGRGPGRLPFRDRRGLLESDTPSRNFTTQRAFFSILRACRKLTHSLIALFLSERAARSCFSCTGPGETKKICLTLDTPCILAPRCLVREEKFSRMACLAFSAVWPREFSMSRT